MPLAAFVMASILFVYGPAPLPNSLSIPYNLPETDEIISLQICPHIYSSCEAECTETPRRRRRPDLLAQRKLAETWSPAATRGAEHSGSVVKGWEGYCS